MKRINPTNSQIIASQIEQITGKPPTIDSAKRSKIFMSVERNRRLLAATRFKKPGYPLNKSTYMLASAISSAPRRHNYNHRQNSRLTSKKNSELIQLLKPN